MLRKELALSGIAGISVAAVIALGFALPFTFGTLGVHDFYEYWAANRLMLLEQNPYDKDALTALLSSQGYANAPPLFCWNPPWLLALMSPMLSGSLANAARIWYFLSLLFFLAATAFSWDMFGAKLRQLPIAVILSFTFSPLVINFLYGQLGSFLAFATCGLLWSLSKGKNLCAGLFLALLSVKLHLFYLLFVLLAWWIIENKRYSIFVSTFSVLGIWIVLARMLHSTTALGYWFSYIGSRPGSTPGIRDWIPATFAGWVGAQIESHSYFSGLYVTWFIASLCAVGLYSFLLWKRPVVPWQSFAPPLLCLSVLTAPYGWPFDFSVLLPCQLGIMFCILDQKSTPKQGKLILIALLLLNMAPLLLWRFYFTFLHELWWYPFALLLIWAWQRSFRIRMP